MIQYKMYSVDNNKSTESFPHSLGGKDHIKKSSLHLNILREEIIFQILG